MKKILSAIILIIFISTNLAYAISPDSYKLSSKSNIGSISREYIPAIRKIIDKIKTGELRPEDVPLELQFLVTISGRTTAKETSLRHADAELTDDEIALIEQYIKKTNIEWFKDLLESLLVLKSSGKQLNASEPLVNVELSLDDEIKLIVNSENIDFIKTGDRRFKLVKNNKELRVEKFNFNNRLFIRIGSRTYEIVSGVHEINLSEIMTDPLFWIGNAELVDFFGEDEVLAQKIKKSPQGLMLVEWDEELRKIIPECRTINGRIIANAYERLKDKKLDPFLQSHYSLVAYFFSFLTDPEVSVSMLDIVSNISNQRVNEFIYRLLGTENVIIPHMVSMQFKKFHAILRVLCELYGAEQIVCNPHILPNPGTQNIVISRLNFILSHISDSDIYQFSSIADINDKLNKLSKEKIDIFDYDDASKTLKINLSVISNERRPLSRQRELTVFQKRGPPNTDIDRVVVEALAYMCTRKHSDVIKRVSKFIGHWRQDWIMNEVLQGISSNHKILFQLDDADCFESIGLGVGRSGFGLGGASIETETWCRDVFSNFIDKIKILAGVFPNGKPYVFPQVYFGPSINKEEDCTGTPLVDAYNYRKLCNALFGDEPLSKGMINAIIAETKLTNFKPVDTDDPALLLATLQEIYDYLVIKLRDELKKWITENNLNILLFGQVLLPNENPVFYPALLKALEEINNGKRDGEKTIALLRHNYFRKKWKTREGIRLRIIQKDDPIKVLVESETNADIFEEYFGFRPTILYEAVHFPEVSDARIKTFREQIREQEDMQEPVENFLSKLAECAERDGKQPVNIADDIIITQPSRLDMNKRPDSTIVLAKNIQRLENEKAEQERRPPRKVRVLFFGSTVRLGPDGSTGLSGVEKEAYELVHTIAREGEIDISNQIYFLGYIPQKEVIAGLTFTHVMSQASDRETFGRTPIEAMATGVPIIYTRDWTYPFDSKDRQVYYTLFGGSHTFPLRPGHTDLKTGEWIKGQVQPDVKDGEIPMMHRRIYNILSNPNSMEEIARVNFLASRRSMFNLRNLENYLKLRFVMAFDPEFKKVRFIDNYGIKSSRVEDLISAIKERDDPIDKDVMDRFSQYATRINASIEIPDNRKPQAATNLFVRKIHSWSKKMTSARATLKNFISQYNTMKPRLKNTAQSVKYIFIDKDALPNNQKDILESENWTRRQKVLEGKFPGYKFIVFSGSEGMDITSVAKDNAMFLLSESNMDKYMHINARIVAIKNAGNEYIYPIDGLICLGIGLLNLNQDDKKGSPLVSSIAKLYSDLTHSKICIETFLETFRIEIVLPPVEKFNTEELLYLQSYALFVLGNAA
jgi:glycosyltransferase involved in cell wall biosynthesis